MHHSTLYFCLHSCPVHEGAVTDSSTCFPPSKSMVSAVFVSAFARNEEECTARAGIKRRGADADSCEQYWKLIDQFGLPLASPPLPRLALAAVQIVPRSKLQCTSQLSHQRTRAATSVGLQEYRRYLYRQKGVPATSSPLPTILSTPPSRPQNQTPPPKHTEGTDEDQDCIDAHALHRRRRIVCLSRG